MKRNVDLTENMMFSQESNAYQAKVLWRKSSEYVLREIPWKMPDEQIFQKNNIIVVGSSSERRRYHKIREIVSDSFCDRCGKEIRILPWRPLTGLCLQCQSQLHQQLTDRCPWRENV